MNVQIQGVFEQNQTIPQPLYAQVQTVLASEILNRVLPPGSQLPSEQQLIERFGVEAFLAETGEKRPKACAREARVGVGRVVDERRPARLGEGDLARQALTRGLAVFAADGPERDRIAAVAQELGVGQ